MTDWRGKTNKDLLELWDAGKPVWTCSMGGLGDDYERCIQRIAMEFLRGMQDAPFDFKACLAMPDDERSETWEDYIDGLRALPAVKTTLDCLKPSGSQHGAAVNLSSVFARHGYERGMEMVPKDRRIQVARLVVEANND